MTFWRTKAFRELNKQWREELEESGFADAEDSKGNLKRPDNRTAGFENRERIADFFRELGHFMANHRLPRRDRVILQLYCDGCWIKDICYRVQMSDSTVRKTIRKYRKLLGAA